MVSTDIANLLRKVEHARVPTETIAQDVTFTKGTGIELVTLDEALDMVKIYSHGVTEHVSGLVDYAILAYYMPQVPGVRMLEELEMKRQQAKLGDRSATVFVDAEGYRVTQGGNTSRPGKDSATIQPGHISGRLTLFLSTYHLNLIRLKFMPAGEVIELKSEEGAVKPERIYEAIAGMRYVIS